MDEYINIFFYSMLPITELRLSIPIGLLEYNMNWTHVFLISIAGNFIVCVPIVYFFKYIEKLFNKNYYSRKILNKIFKRTRARGKLINLYKYYGIILFVGIPLPFTGAWTGCLASYLFGFGKKKTLAAIMFGLCLSASIVTLTTFFVRSLLIYIGYDGAI